MCGADKVWRRLQREGIEVARCAIEHRMRCLCLHEIMCRKVVRITFGDAAVPYALDPVSQKLSRSPGSSLLCRRKIPLVNAVINRDWRSCPPDLGGRPRRRDGGIWPKAASVEPEMLR